MRRFALALVLALAGVHGGPAPAATRPVKFTAEVWADNWFELYVNGKRVGQDSVPLKTERSFNMETIGFTATYPLTIGLVAKDYVENASGLEYIGKPNQQIGDGGIIMQIHETLSKRLVTATDGTWKLLVVNSAPTNPECVASTAPLTDCKSLTRTIPKTWLASTFTTNTWRAATEYTPEAVGVKEGYLQVRWEPTAKLIWSSDLRLDNTLLFRTRILAPSATAIETSATFAIDNAGFPNGILPTQYTCDGAGQSPALNWSAPPTGTKSLAVLMDGEAGPPRPGETATVHYYLVLYNLPASQRKISAGTPGVGTLGLNFKDRSPGYTPPCSQGPGAKQYRLRVFALSSPVDLTPSSATGDALLAAIASRTLATAALQLSYS